MSKILPEIDVAPDFRPLRVEVAVQRLAEIVGGGLIVVLQHEDLGDPIVRQRTRAVHVERLLKFLQRLGELADLDKLLAAADRDRDAHRMAEAQHPVVRIERDLLRFAERLDDELRRRAGRLRLASLPDCLRFRFASPPACGTCPDPARFCPSREIPWMCGKPCIRA